MRGKATRYLRAMFGSGAVAVMAVMLAVSVSAPAAAWVKQQCAVGGESVIVKPGISTEVLRKTLNLLRQGDTLYMAPGTYDIGFLGIYSCHASADHRITVTALDPANPPLLRGYVFLNSPDNWTLSHLRIEAAKAGSPALKITGGVGWVVDKLEIFGASRTGGYANLMLGAQGDKGPTGFSVVNSCIHDAAKKGEVQFHNVYVNSQSGQNTSGQFSNNVIFNHPSGAGIKLGVGGNENTLGPWNIKIDHNTIVRGAFGVVFNGRVSRATVTNNLFGSFRKLDGAGLAGRRSAVFYAHFLKGSGNRALSNYMFNTDQWLRRTGSASVVIARDNVRGPAPTFSGMGCNGWRTVGRAANYGRYI